MQRMELIKPGPDQESVWDYPRPPRVEPSSKHIEIIFNGVVVADTHRAQRVVETSHPPVYYIPPQDVRIAHLQLTSGATICEWKGRAVYYTLTVGERRAINAIWSYPDPTPHYGILRDYLAFYPSKMDRCCVDGEQVSAQPGDFYGGWITREIVGPFKGDPGTWGW